MANHVIRIPARTNGPLWDFDLSGLAREQLMCLVIDAATEAAKQSGATVVEVLQIAIDTAP